MKLRLTCAVIVGMLLSLPAVAQLPGPTTPFSADLIATADRGGDMPHDIRGKIYFSSGRLRMDTQGPQGAVIMITNANTRTADMLMPAQHIYMEFKTDQGTTGRPGMGPSVRPFRDPSNPCADEKGNTCKKIGVEQVNGRTCDRWQITAKDGSVSNVWVDQKLHFPIKTVTGKDTWQLTNIKEGEPAASFFTIPPGYRKLDMGGMMGGTQPPSR
jgi:Domain of unknown function (DUF4412)